MQVKSIFEEGTKVFQWREDGLFNKWYWNNCIFTGWNKPWPKPHPYSKIKSKWFINLNVKHYTCRRKHRRKSSRGAWVAQLVKCLNLDFSSGHDLMVHGIKPCIWLCADSMEPAWVLSPPLSLPLPYVRCHLFSLSLSLSLSKKWINKHWEKDLQELSLSR